MNKILDYFNKKHGYVRSKELRDRSFQFRDIAELVKKGKIDKIKPGLYRLANLEDGKISRSFVDVCSAMPKGVICLASSLSHFELTTFNPSEIYVAIPHKVKYTPIEFPPVKVYYFRDIIYKTGIESIQTPHGIVRIYGIEKTICDMFRYRKKLGEDMALEALRNYLRRKSANIPKLEQIAELCSVKKIITPYLKALVQ